ncbi:sensor histidine kinase [Oceanobacillus bengalensis]|uniref:histidine kinase n=1 Tax=Oceanobacillus bengalensis TaxID=1435466 RepID=A0A494YZH7_9BACI|nr:sensor histidine kinase [Oceanobacillus bengalensis]RKQ15562.1 sensor histidine kinase [Oceanobacillus bengalensis]
MVKKYLIERLHWIVLFCFFHLLLLFIGFIDPTINISSISYFVFLSTIIFIVFLFVQYHREVKYYKSIEEWHPSMDIESVKLASSPFEKILEEFVTLQNEFYKEETNRSLTAIEQEKDELLSWIHEVKTPLTTMQLMIERIEDESLRVKLQYEWLRIHLLLDQQLHQKRIPFMENDLYIEKVELEPLLFNEIRELKSWCFQKGIGFDVELDVKEVLSDAKWLSFMIRQVLTNAVKYSDAADIQIISFRKKGLAQLQITDAGRGIDGKDLPRIFEKGFTSTSNHKDNAATGMGLYLTKKVAKALKIHIDVASTPGEGTTFILTFAAKNDFVAIRSM